MTEHELAVMRLDEKYALALDVLAHHRPIGVPWSDYDVCRSCSSCTCTSCQVYWPCQTAVLAMTVLEIPDEDRRPRG